MAKLVIAVTGASGMLTAKTLIEKSPWPVSLVASDWGKDVYERECGPFMEMARHAHEVFDNRDLSAPIASGSVTSVGMIIAPCSANTLGQIAAGIAPSLIPRAAHCHLKEKRPLILCVREAPWSLIDLENGRKVAAAGAVVMPISPPFFMTAKRDPNEVSMAELIALFADRVLALLGHAAPATWESVR